MTRVTLVASDAIKSVHRGYIRTSHGNMEEKKKEKKSPLEDHVECTP
jgi:hypothetical protein